MRHVRHYLQQSSLFADMDDRQVYEILEGLQYRISSFAAGQIVASEGAPCSHLGIILTGEARVQRIYRSGRTLTMHRLRPGTVFGEVIIFSEHREHPATIEAADDETQIMFVAREEIAKLCYAHPTFLQNFLGMLSEKLLNLNRRVKLLSQPTIRSKVINYLLSEAERQESYDLHLQSSRRELARELGIPRPSLSREMGNMRREGLIEFRGQTVQLRDPRAMHESLEE